MGLLLRANCSSCLADWELLEGNGMAGIEYQPRICRDCKQLVSVPLKLGIREAGRPIPERCPACAGANLKVFDLAGLESGWPVGELTCPQCDGEVEIENAGIWD